MEERKGIREMLPRSCRVWQPEAQRWAAKGAYTSRRDARKAAKRVGLYVYRCTGSGGCGRYHLTKIPPARFAADNE